MNTAPDTLPLRLVAIRYAAQDINLYEFRPLDGGRLPDYEPGAHIDLHLPGGLVRQYSLAEVATGLSYEIGVKRDAASRGGSSYLHDTLRVGAILPVGLPRNHFPLAEGPAPSVLLAGGIGITPMHCMVQALAAAGRPWELHYAVRSRAEAAFLAELEACPGGRVRLHVDDEIGTWLDVAAVVAAAPADAHLYCCGPAPMLEAFIAAGRGRPADHVHYEYFSAPAPAAGGERGAATGGFTVELARAGRSLHVPAGQTIVQALREQGVEIPVSCEQGVCGACEVRVLAGRPDHRDLILTPEEKAACTLMLPCVSGCLDDRLVLDL